MSRICLRLIITQNENELVLYLNNEQKYTANEHILESILFSYIKKKMMWKMFLSGLSQCVFFTVFLKIQETCLPMRKHACSAGNRIKWIINLSRFPNGLKSSSKDPRISYCNSWINRLYKYQT